jgi:chromosome segregation protein
LGQTASQAGSRRTPYLRSITLKGFKSFPDRCKLEFGPGVSVIVGPNGSGKSNVTDAVLWALGEQSPINVRGQSMQDVIFGGAPGRQAAKGAEVELVLDDSEGSLGLGVPEISIVRRLDRNGEGEYRLAGARCRLVDVIELLSDTGLGKEMHSVISQGRVESIVTSKPRDRRLLIEEAAGLGKHRKRRRRAQLKLQRTQDNLDRALDVEREARSRLRPLKRQAEAAELHARIERQALEARWELARDDLRIRRAALEEATRAVAAARAARTEVEAELEHVSKRRQQAEEALAARSAEREELSRRCFAARSAGERVEYRVESVKRAAESVDARLAGGREALGSAQAELAMEVADPDAAARIAALQGSLAELDRDREAELGRQLAQLERDREAATADVARLDGAVTAAEAARVDTDKRLEQARAAVREAELGTETARREAARIGGELAAANQFLRAHTAVRAGSTALADELEVDAGFELALAAALDGRLGAAIVADRASAGDLLDRAGADGARALIHGGAAARERAAPPTADATALLDHVRGPATALALASVLLADAWVVPEIGELPDDFAGVGVTAAGRVWSPSTRELRQAPAVGEERVLAERNRRDQLVRASEAAAQGELDAGAAHERATVAVSAADAARQEAVESHRAAVTARDEAAESERRIAASIARRRSAPDDGPAGERRARLTAELAGERDKLERAERAATVRAARIVRLQAAIERDQELGPIVASLLGALADAQAVIAVRVELFEAALAADRDAGEHIATELRSCAQAEAGLQARLHAANEALTEAEVRTQRARDQADDAETAVTEVAGRLGLEPQPGTEAVSEEDREALRSRLERLARRREQIGPVNPLAQEEYAEAVEHVEELERQRADLETALRELEKLIADTDREIRERFEQTFDAAASNFEELAAQLFPGGRGRLRLVTEHDGPARVLGGEPAPNGAGDGANGADTEADAEDEREDEDLHGVEIEITPAGKAMKRLSLLSGGEKSMTALAFMFAVFLARPCPFYILDEVEAALDDLNIDRFLELLRKYSERAQFIVVTHQKRTMEAADSLYGVSMGGDGISKVISRKLPAEAAAA